MSANDSNSKVVRLGEPVPEEVTRRVGEEVLRGNLDPGIWAQALASAKGSGDEALAVYSRLRIDDLVERRNRVRQKAESMEFRRLNACLGVKTVRELLQGMSRLGAVNLPRPRIPMLWLALLVIGFAGCVSALVRLVPLELPTGLHRWLPLVALAGAAGLIALLVPVGRRLPVSVLRWFCGDGVLGACALVCLGSLLLGTKLMMANPVVVTSAADPYPEVSAVDHDRVAGGLIGRGIDVPAMVAVSER